MTDQIELVDVNASNVERLGFFCYMSKRKAEGYRRKLDWLGERFAEGMRIRMLPKPLRGFIEYAPGESTWRALHADGYLVIHCVWVVGRSKGAGYGHELVEACERDAREHGYHGVAVLTSERVWMAGRALFQLRGYECVEEAEPEFTLLAKRFTDAPLPRLAGDWERKAAALGDGLHILHTPQCPYVPDAVAHALAAAEEAGVPASAQEITSRTEILARVPNPYGVFAMTLDGRPLSYHYLLPKELTPLLAGR